MKVEIELPDADRSAARLIVPRLTGIILVIDANIVSDALPEAA